MVATLVQLRLDPLVYKFLPTKSQAHYNRFFTIVKEDPE